MVQAWWTAALDGVGRRNTGRSGLGAGRKKKKKMKGGFSLGELIEREGADGNKRREGDWRERMSCQIVRGGEKRKQEDEEDDEEDDEMEETIEGCSNQGDDDGGGGGGDDDND
ncbi:histone chaperone RTT106 [Asparagus officinalis]|uniref:histone chaperone RTT106 n=1 Tax=Asparagus officinalis TaxID=4686 RepID=UPI00098E824A|nr:histone chaperone RTT106 [Asparagus officinalis]